MGDAALPGTTVPTVSRSQRQRLSRDEFVMRGGLILLGAWLLITLVLPVWALLSKSVEGKDQQFVGLANFVRYAENPALSGSIINSLFVALVSTVICVGLSFTFAYGLTRTCMRGRAVFKLIAQIPLLAPSLLPAISLVYLFGNQGLAKGVMLGHSIYGPVGIIAGEVFWTLPHALIIVTTALSTADARLYEAAQSLKASPFRIFWTVTLPGARYGLISAFFAVFTLVITDFGVPKVVGGQYNVLATDIYKQVIGQQQFQMGAVVGFFLLMPAVLAFVVDRIVQRRQLALLSARAVPYHPKPNRSVDVVFFGICLAISATIVLIIAVAVLASIATFWPYDLTPSLKNYNFDLTDGGGWDSYQNSIVMSVLTAAIGPTLIYTGAYLVEKTSGFRRVRALVQFMALLPLAVPGLVLGLGYIFFFNNTANPLQFLYGSMAILVICTIAHFWSVAHLTALTALKQIDSEFETVSASLRVPVWRTFLRVTVPVNLPVICDMALYMFINAMTTVSAVVFLYSPSTMLASVAVLNMDDAGDVAPAAAMAMMIFMTAALVRIGYSLVVPRVLVRTQTWRHN